MNYIKIPSGEITNLPYLQHIGRMGKPIIMSTGMATLEEVRTAFNLLLEAGTEKNQITILHCNTEYPTPMEDVNLKAMITIRDELGVNVGYSDHTLGIEVPIAAAAMGATVIEKHFTLDRTLPGPDHAMSLEPSEFEDFVNVIRETEAILGDGIKKSRMPEIENKVKIRRSIVAKYDLKSGHILTFDDLDWVRPGGGIRPGDEETVIGKKLTDGIKAGEMIELNYLV